MGPRRTTISFSSEDAPELGEGHKVYVYYCKYSGKHALTTDCNLNTAPRRRTDHALVLDTSKHTIKLYTTDGGVKFIKRRSGNVEKQYRLNIGKLPIGYKTEPTGRYLYILDNALTTYSSSEGVGDGGKAPVPPCIVASKEGGAIVAIEIEDRGSRRLILKISGDFVRVQIKQSLQSSGAIEELLDYMRTILGVRLSQLTIEKGASPRHKHLIIYGMLPESVFEKFNQALQVGRSRS